MRTPQFLLKLKSMKNWTNFELNQKSVLIGPHHPTLGVLNEVIVWYLCSHNLACLYNNILSWLCSSSSQLYTGLVEFMYMKTSAAVLFVQKLFLVFSCRCSNFLSSQFSYGGVVMHLFILFDASLLRYRENLISFFAWVLAHTRWLVLNWAYIITRRICG
jgi:hypothetical protein